MKLFLVVGHERGRYEEDYNLIGIYDNETLARSIADKDTDFDTYEIQTCNLNNKIDSTPEKLYLFENEHNENLTKFVNELIDEIQVDSCYIYEDMNPPEYAKAMARGHANVLRKKFKNLIEGNEP